MSRFCPAGVVLGVALLTACGPTGPSAARPASDPPLATGVWAADIEAVTHGIAEELRALGLDIVVGSREPAGVFSAGGQRIDIPSLPDDRITIYVYRTVEQAQSEATRIPTGANQPPPTGPRLARVTYVRPMHFYYRERVIAAHAGCDAALRRAMETIFGPSVESASDCRR